MVTCRVSNICGCSASGATTCGGDDGGGQTPPLSRGGRGVLHHHLLRATLSSNSDWRRISAHVQALRSLAFPSSTAYSVKGRNT